MGRSKDKVWEYVTMVGDYNASGIKRWKCMFCRAEHIGSTRIKIHLSETKRNDITPCPNVPKAVSAFYTYELLTSRGPIQSEVSN